MALVNTEPQFFLEMVARRIALLEKERDLLRASLQEMVELHEGGANETIALMVVDTARGLLQNSATIAQSVLMQEPFAMTPPNGDQQ